MPIGAETFREALRMGAEVFHTLKKVLKAAATTPPSATKAASRRTSSRPRRRSSSSSNAIEKAGYKPGKDIALALDCAATEFFKDGKYVFEGEGKTRGPRRAGRLPRRAGAKYPDRLDRGRHGGRRLGRLEGAHRRDRRPSASSSATTSSSPTPSASPKGIERGVANSILVKVNQIGTLTETLDAVEMAHQRRLHRGHVAPLRRDRGRDHRRPRRRDQLRPDQDRLARPLRPHREVQPAPPHRGRTRHPGGLCRRVGLRALTRVRSTVLREVAETVR